MNLGHRSDQDTCSRSRTHSIHTTNSQMTHSTSLTKNRKGRLIFASSPVTGSSFLDIKSNSTNFVTLTSVFATYTRVPIIVSSSISMSATMSSSTAAGVVSASVATATVFSNTTVVITLSMVTRNGAIGKLVILMSSVSFWMVDGGSNLPQTGNCTLVVMLHY